MTNAQNGHGDGRDVFDVTIVGAGPTGLFAAFYAGMRQIRAQVIDSLEEPGGALTAIYPEKYIYDIAGFPKVLAKDFVEQMVIQAMRQNPTMRLKEQVGQLEIVDDGIFKISTSNGDRFSKSVIICGGVGAFEPKKIPAPGVDELEGRGVHYFAKRVEDFRDKDVVIVGGGDSAADWAITLEPVAKSVTLIHRSKFRAHEATITELEGSTVDLRYPGCEVVSVSEDESGHLASVTYKNADSDGNDDSSAGTDRGDWFRGGSGSAQNLGVRSSEEPDRGRQNHHGNEYPGGLRGWRYRRISCEIQTDRNRRGGGRDGDQSCRHPYRPHRSPRSRSFDQHYGLPRDRVLIRERSGDRPCVNRQDENHRCVGRSHG